MASVYELDPAVGFEIFTTVPPWFFEESPKRSSAHHPLLTDIGLIQKTPLNADLARTVERLDQFLPFEEDRIRELAKKIERLKCQLVICDIAPMGVAVARQAGVPSLLVENFTWDWVYQAYAAIYDGLKRHAAYLGRLSREADYRVQAQPVCSPGPADMTVLPVSREARAEGIQIRHRLGIPEGDKMVLVTMGGVPQDHPSWERPIPQQDIHLVISGAGNSFSISDHRVTLPYQSEFFHPDLVAAADAVVGKLGYSTLAEVYHEGTPFGFIKRPNFQESEILAAYVERHMMGVSISAEDFVTGEWMSHISRLLEMPRIARKGPNGATQIAEFVCNIVL